MLKILIEVWVGNVNLYLSFHDVSFLRNFSSFEIRMPQLSKVTGKGVSGAAVEVFFLGSLEYGLGRGFFAYLTFPILWKLALFPADMVIAGKLGAGNGCADTLGQVMAVLRHLGQLMSAGWGVGLAVA
jgi:hypothetical protein